MPYFQVVLEGEGVDLPAPETGDSAFGFYTTRIVKARDVVHAGEVACLRELAVWREGGIHAHGHVPRLTLESVTAIGYFKGRFGRQPRGYSFFTRKD